LSPWIPGSVVLNPCFGIVFVAVGKREVRVDGIRREKTKNLALICLIDILCTVVVFVGASRRSVVDVAGKEQALPFIGWGVANRVIFVSAVATKVHGIEPLLGIPWKKLLAFNSDGPTSRRL